jgi:hypothetical protein
MHIASAQAAVDAARRLRVVSFDIESPLESPSHAFDVAALQWAHLAALHYDEATLQ